MASRLTLHQELISCLGNNNVYFQPPESLKINYPCIIYNLDKIQTLNADNTAYKTNKRYQLTLIHKDPDNEIVDKLEALPMCTLDRTFTTSNLNHYVFTLYY